MGNKGRQAHPDAEESIIFRDYDGVLEFAGCYLFAGRVDLMGHAELWERAAAAGNWDRARSSAREVSGCQSGTRIREFVRPSLQIGFLLAIAFGIKHRAFSHRGEVVGMKNLRVWEVASVDMPDLLIGHTVPKARAVGLISQSASIGAPSAPIA